MASYLEPYVISISIHAPREGSDPYIVGNIVPWLNFNPRSP